MRGSEPIVLDASVLVEYLAPGQVDLVEPLLVGPVQHWIPDHCLVEVANALRRYQRGVGRGSLTDIGAALEDLLDLRPVIVGSEALISAAVRHLDRLTAYDAVYLALAEARDAPLCTLDRRQADAAERTGVKALVPGTQPFTAWLRDRQA